MLKGSLAGRIGRMAGVSRPERVLIAASFVNRVGNGLFNAASALYFTLIVGLPAEQVGAALTIAGVIGLCAGVPGGYLADRRGARIISMLALAVQAISMAALVLVESWAALTITATVGQIAAAASGAAWGALVARVGEERPALFRAKLRTFVNLGVILGTVGAGLALAANTRGAYVAVILGNAASFALCAVLLLLLPRYPVLAAPPQQRRWLAFADRPFLTFTALYGAMGLQYPVVSLLLPIWISEHTEAPRWTVAALFAVNAAFCVLTQTKIGSRIETPHDGGRAFRIAGLLFLVSCPMMALAAHTPVLGGCGTGSGRDLRPQPGRGLGVLGGLRPGLRSRSRPRAGPVPRSLRPRLQRGPGSRPRDPHHGRAQPRHGGLAAPGGVLRSTGRCRPTCCPLGRADPAAAGRCCGSDGMTKEQLCGLFRSTCEMPAFVSGALNFAALSCSTDSLSVMTRPLPKPIHCEEPLNAATWGGGQTARLPAEQGHMGVAFLPATEAS
ncbi:MFS transporter [Streptomyces sp. PmtG]